MTTFKKIITITLSSTLLLIGTLSADTLTVAKKSKAATTQPVTTEQNQKNGDARVNTTSNRNPLA